MFIYPKRFYVYMHLREDGTPYYIGKGKASRAWSDNRTLNLPKDKDNIIIHTEDLSESEAFSLEIELIKKYGRKDIGTGILRNLTEGGAGVCGQRFTTEHRRKTSKSMAGRKYTKEHRENISKGRKGIEFSSKHRENIRIATTGRIQSQETIRKKSTAMKNKRWFNNGLVSRRSETCPKGFVPGRLPFKR